MSGSNINSNAATVVGTNNPDTITGGNANQTIYGSADTTAGASLTGGIPVAATAPVTLERPGTIINHTRTSAATQSRYFTLAIRLSLPTVHAPGSI